MLPASVALITNVCTTHLSLEAEQGKGQLIE
jgi:hypothetical protein